MFRALEPWHVIVLIVVLVLLFGSKRLPDAARGLGRSMRIFKAEVKDMKDHDDTAPRAEAPREIPPVEGRVVDEPRRAPETERHDA